MMTDAETLANFAAEQHRCWACHVIPDTRPWSEYTTGLDHPRHLEIHHIYGASGRKHWRENLSRLCRLCHDLAEGHQIRWFGKPLPRLSLSNVLWLKRENDEEHFKPERLRELALSFYVPEPEELPEWFLRERELREHVHF